MAGRGVNKVILIGNLGGDPELRSTPGGTSVASFTLATNESHRIVVWSRLAEICGQYLRKGSQVYIEGRLQTRSWEDKQGNQRKTTEIVARDMQMLGARSEGNGARSEAGAGTPEFAAETVKIADDDLPF